MAEGKSAGDMVGNKPIPEEKAVVTADHYSGYALAKAPEGFDGTDDDWSKELHENIKGTSTFPTVGVDGEFVITDSEGVEKRSKSMSGVILSWYPTNVCWMETFEDVGRGQKPICQCFFGSTPSRQETTFKDAAADYIAKKTFIEMLDKVNNLPVFGNCDTCLFNTWRSAQLRSAQKYAKAKGKFCANRGRIFLLMPGQLIPWLLPIPPTTLGIVEKQMTLLTQSNKPFWSVEAQITVAKDTSDEGYKFDKITVDFLGSVDSSDLSRIRALKDTLMPMMTKVPAMDAEAEDLFSRE